MLKILTSVILIFVIGCKGIKKDNVQVKEEAGTEISFESKPANTSAVQNPLVGYWVGDFEPDIHEDSLNKLTISADEGLYWQRENKINISIDKIEDSIVTGHSVVAGNNRPFTGKVTSRNGALLFSVREPGDKKHDGNFKFEIKDSVLAGTWESFKPTQISKRKFTLRPKTFNYDPDIMLDEHVSYIEWEKMRRGGFNDEFEDFSTEYATATDKIYAINASTRLLTKKEVANLKRGDLVIIRNTIYARHGYSFKSFPLRVFFDKQSWYVPVSADIRSELTEIEKKNIKLLLSYEKNAKEYYDYFGRT